ncbi:MAG: hypothetical protein WBF43_02050, partial [Methylocella sp.]
SPAKSQARAMRDHRRAIAALSMAIQRQRPAPGLIRHSDRGSQYAAADGPQHLYAWESAFQPAPTGAVEG